MISAGYGRSGRPAHALSRARTASLWYPSTWFSDATEMSHDSRLLPAYLNVASAAKEARYNAPQRSDGGALIACFQASVAALRSRTSSGHGVCASACAPSQAIAINVKTGTPFSVMEYPRKRWCRRMRDGRPAILARQVRQICDHPIRATTAARRQAGSSSWGALRQRAEQRTRQMGDLIGDAARICVGF